MFLTNPKGGYRYAHFHPEVINCLMSLREKLAEFSFVFNFLWVPKPILIHSIVSFFTNLSENNPWSATKEIPSSLLFLRTKTRADIWHSSWHQDARVPYPALSYCRPCEAPQPTGSLSPTCETWTELTAPGCGLAQPQLPRPFRISRKG